MAKGNNIEEDEDMAVDETGELPDAEPLLPDSEA
jgi:hypothetical protein